MAQRRNRIPVSPNQIPLFGEQPKAELVYQPQERAAFIGSLMPISQDVESVVAEIPPQTDRNSMEEMVMSRYMAIGQLGKESQLASFVSNELPQREAWSRYGNQAPRVTEGAERKRVARVKAARALFVRSTGKAMLKEGVSLVDVRSEKDLDFGTMPEEKRQHLVAGVESIVQSLRGPQGAEARTELKKQLKKLAKDNDIVLPKVK